MLACKGTPAFDEMERQFGTEFDYRREAAAGAQVRANLAAAGAAIPSVVVPRVHAELCTKRVLVMEEIYPATPLTRALEQQAAGAAKAAGFSGTTAEFVAAEKARAEALARAAAEQGQLVASHDAASLGRYIAFQRARQALRRGARWAFNGTVGWAVPRWRLGGGVADGTGAGTGGGGGDGGGDVFVPINTARLVDDLLAVHGWEVLIDGCFNADPHPGNILYIAAGGGEPERLGLIDYGQVRRALSRKARRGVSQVGCVHRACTVLGPC